MNLKKTMTIKTMDLMSNKVVNMCNVLRARISNCIRNVLIESGAQISLITKGRHTLLCMHEYTCLICGGGTE